MDAIHLALAFVMLVLLICLTLEVPVQLISYCAWRWFRLSRTHYLFLATTTWIAINFGVVRSAYLDYQRAVVESAQPPIPGITSQAATIPLASHQMLLNLLIVVLFIGIPINFYLSQSIFRQNKLRQGIGQIN